MCETEHGERPWQLYIRDMYEFSKKVLTYTKGLNQDEFVAESLIYDATLRNKVIRRAYMQLRGLINGNRVTKAA